MAGFAVHACSDSSTGPSSVDEGPSTAVFSVRIAMPADAAARALQLTRARVVVRRADQSVAYDEFHTIPASVSVLEARAEVDLLAGEDGESFTIDAELFTATGAAVFRGDPASVRGEPDQPPPPVLMTMRYVGPGAQAQNISITPSTASLKPGESLDLMPKATTSAGAEVPAAPVYWTSLDPAIVSVPNSQVGRVVAGASRGTARVRASLVSGQSADATITVVPAPSAMSIHSGNGQGGTPNSQLPQALVVRVTAPDGLGVSGVPVDFAVTSGGGFISANQVVTDADGLAGVHYTFGPTAGPVSITASVEGLAGSPATFTVESAGDAAAQLVFISQPTDAVVGAPMSAIVVEARDESGSRATSFDGAVTLALDDETGAATAGGFLRAAQTAGVQLLGTLTVNAVGGVATFLDVSVSAPAASLRLRATAVGVASTGTSAAFAASPGAPGSLVFATQPTSIVASNPLPTIVVQARDGFGNLAANYTGQVTLALDGAPGVTLQGTTSVDAIGGVATFGGLTVSTAVPSARVAATATGIPGTVFSSSFAVTQPVTSVIFNPPSRTFSALRTEPSPPAATVQITATGTVTNLALGAITYGSGANGWLTASLSGTSTPATLTLTPSTSALPVGTFTASVPISGSGGLSTSYPVSVTISALPASQIAVITEPAGAASGTAFGTQPVIELRDASGARVLTANNAVTVSRASGTGTLSGTLTRNAVQGRVTFTDLRINGTGAHTLTFAASGLTSATSASFTVGPALSTTQAVPSTIGTVGTPIAPFTPVTASGGVPPYNFVRSGGPLPSGMTFNSSSGQVSGTPTSSLATTTYTVTVTDAVGATSSRTFQLRVNGPLSTTQAVPSTSWTVNRALPSFVPVTAGGGTAPYTFAITSGSLPSGLSFNASTGAVSGTPTTTGGPLTITVTVTDAASSTSSKTFSLTINPAVSTTQAVASRVGTADAALSSFTPVTASGGTPPYTYALSGGSLPAGMNFNTTSGLVSGAPTTALATTVFTVQVTDVAGSSSSRTFQLTVNPALVTTLAVPSVTGTQGIAIPSFTPVTISAGTPPYTRVLGGALPSGMSFNTGTGEISGTPTSPMATKSFTVFATDAVGATSQKTFQLTVNPPLTTTQAVPSTTSAIGVALSFTPVTASGGSPPRVFALTGGTLPNGLAFNTGTGEIAGTPTATLGATVFTVTVTDAVGATSFKTFSLTIGAGLSTTQAVPSTTGTVGVPIPAFIPVTASGGSTPYSFALSGGTLPSGMTFNTSTGQVSGTPTQAKVATVYTVTVTDALGATSFKTFTLTVNNALVTTQAVPNTTGTVNQVLGSFTPVTATGGALPYSFALSGGSLPTGLTFNTSTGQISGTPTATLATTMFTVTVTDALGAQSSKTFNLTIENVAPTGIVLEVGPNSTESINGGQQLAIPLEVDMSGAGGENIASITVTITWDPARFSFSSQTAGTWSGTVIPNTSQTASGTLQLTGFDVVGTTTSFILRNITLTALATGAPVVTPITATIQTAGNEVGSPVTVTARNLTVTINP